jgi:hypothetical protein
MSTLKVLGFISIVGAVLSALGCYLPWAQSTPMQHAFFYPGGLIYGMTLTVGIFAVLGCLVAFFSHVFFIAKGKNYAVLVAFVGGLVAYSCSSAWILEPGVFESGVSLLYGAHVTLVGAIIILIATTLLLVKLSEKTVKQNSEFASQNPTAAENPS